MDCAGKENTCQNEQVQPPVSRRRAEHSKYGRAQHNCIRSADNGRQCELGYHRDFTKVSLLRCRHEQSFQLPKIEKLYKTSRDGQARVCRHKAYCVAQGEFVALSLGGMLVNIAVLISENTVPGLFASNI